MCVLGVKRGSETRLQESVANGVFLHHNSKARKRRMVQGTACRLGVQQVLDEKSPMRGGKEGVRPAVQRESGSHRPRAVCSSKRLSKETPGHHGDGVNEGGAYAACEC